MSGAVVLASTLLALAAPGALDPPAGAPRPRVVAGGTVARGAFGFDDVQRLAQQRAAHDFRPPDETLPRSLEQLTYDQYRDIRFRPESALWRGQSLFEVQFFHRGYRTRQKINVFEVSASGVVPVPYRPQYFTFGRLLKSPPGGSATLGYAGLRVHFPLQTPEYKDELIAFLGASYFRVLGRNQHYGASARGLAVDTAEPGGEEFPLFTDFWLVRPQPADRSLTVYALLDSKSVAGAYQFLIRPGAVTQVEVHSVLYPRRAITRLGIAPLTSMFLYGEDGPRRFDDYRPQVHDSDGLMTETGRGEWIWRPLANPRELRVNVFMDEHLRGFGLIQRQRDFSRYQDAESLFESRPSYWVQPLGDWGRGGTELVEIPSEEEIHDNIVAFWVPEGTVVPGRPLSFAYLLSAYARSDRWPPGGRVVATRSGSPLVGDNHGRAAPGARRVVVDFAGGELDGLSATQPVKADLAADNAQVEAVTVQRLAANGAWRVAFIATPRSKRPVDLRCQLTLHGEVLSETWVYQWTP